MVQSTLTSQVGAQASIGSTAPPSAGCENTSGVTAVIIIQFSVQFANKLKWQICHNEKPVPVFKTMYAKRAQVSDLQVVVEPLPVSNKSMVW